MVTPTQAGRRSNSLRSFLRAGAVGICKKLSVFCSRFARGTLRILIFSASTLEGFEELLLPCDVA